MTTPSHTAQQIYARGVDTIERLGLPLSCLRIYHQLLNPGYPKYYWVWDGTKWERRSRENEGVACANTKLKQYRRGIWAEFETLDEAREHGMKAKETKLGPFNKYDHRGDFLQKKGR